MSPTLTVCTSCKFPDAEGVVFGQGGGDSLAGLIEQAGSLRVNPPRLVRHACLWACAHSCAILITAAGKTGYVAGRFAPTSEAAVAILDWTEAYSNSETGMVPYALWPDGIKGHFLARIPADWQAAARQSPDTQAEGDS